MDTDKLKVTLDPTQINLRLPFAYVEEIDKLRGDVPRNTWILRLVEQAIQAKTNTLYVPPGGGKALPLEVPGGELLAPRSRASSQAKRNVKPIPKTKS